MNPQMDHIEVSELLKAFAEGGLDSRRADEVRKHLDGCSDCAAELEALELLLGLPVEEPSELDARRLHDRVVEAVRSETAVAAAQAVPAGQTLPAAAKPVPARYRMAQALGAAAVLVVVAGVSWFAVSQNDNGSFESGVGESSADLEKRIADIGTELTFQQPEPAAEPESGAFEIQKDSREERTVLDPSSDEGGAVAGGAAGSAEQAPPPPLYVRGAGILNDRTLDLLGRYGLPLVLFPSAYTPAEAIDLQTDFLQRLANAAESEARAEQVLRCGSAVLARPHPVLPALATFGRLENRLTLVMAFAWTDVPDGKLDRFMVWTWPMGNCDTIPSYRAGYINR